MTFRPQTITLWQSNRTALLDICNIEKPHSCFKAFPAFHTVTLAYWPFPVLTWHDSWIRAWHELSVQATCLSGETFAATNVFTNHIYRCPQKATGLWWQLNMPAAHNYFLYGYSPTFLVTITSLKLRLILSTHAKSKLAKRMTHDKNIDRTE
jgi:hypothetical protein